MNPANPVPMHQPLTAFLPNKVVYYKNIGSPIPLLIEWRTTPNNPNPTDLYDNAVNINPNIAKITVVTILIIKFIVYAYGIINFTIILGNTSHNNTTDV